LALPMIARNHPPRGTAGGKDREKERERPRRGKELSRPTIIFRGTVNLLKNEGLGPGRRRQSPRSMSWENAGEKKRRARGNQKLGRDWGGTKPQKEKRAPLPYLSASCRLGKWGGRGGTAGKGGGWSARDRLFSRLGDLLYHN